MSSEIGLEEMKRLAQAVQSKGGTSLLAANPAAVLALIERVEMLELDNAQLKRDNQYLERDQEAMQAVRDALREQVSALMQRVEVAEAARSESVVTRGEDTVRVYEFWKRDPDGTTTRRLECAECGHVFQQSQEEAK